jgi:hypothetical protein
VLNDARESGERVRIETATDSYFTGVFQVTSEELVIDDETRIQMDDVTSVSGVSAVAEVAGGTVVAGGLTYLYVLPILLLLVLAGL